MKIFYACCLFTAISCGFAGLVVPPGFVAVGDQAEPYTRTGRAGEIRHQASGIVFVYIPAGQFNTRIPTDDDKIYGPKRHVRIGEGFYLGKYEVTNEVFAKVRNKIPVSSGLVAEFTSSLPTGATNSKKAERLPVTRINQYHCHDFVKVLGPKFDLPTEEEWEYACRAGTATAYSFGDNYVSGKANIKEERQGRRFTAPPMDFGATSSPDSKARDASSKSVSAPEPADAKASHKSDEDSGGIDLSGLDDFAVDFSSLKDDLLVPSVAEEQAPASGAIAVDACFANPWRLHGMHGNVSEWTRQIKIARGGNFSLGPKEATSAFRTPYTEPYRGHEAVGFRVAYYPGRAVR